MSSVKPCESIQGVKILNCKLGRRERAVLRKVFDEFSGITRRFAMHRHHNEKPEEWTHAHWVYRERAHIGFFAAAIWLAGGLALEEYSSEKSRIARKARTAYKGRNDLWFSLDGPTNFVMEGKHVVSKFMRSKNKFRPIQKKLAEACSNAEQGCVEDTEPLGMVFVTLDSLLRKGDDSAAVSKGLKRWKKEAIDYAKGRNCAFVAWFFPREARKLAADFQGKKYWNPGVAMFAAFPKAFRRT